MQKKLLILILIFFNFSVYSADGQIVRDIKIEGLQRVDPGFVFDNIPFEIDDLIEEVNFSQAINLLYRTGQFKNISIELEGRDIIIVVSERPIISQINFHGTETFQPKRLVDGIASMNIASGLVLDKSVLKEVEKELINQYLSYGKYAASIKTIVTPLQRNRVDIDFYIDEGTNSRIKEIGIVGATKFSQEDLLGLLELQTTSFMSWWNQDDRYSKQKLTGDLERIRSFYMNRGYMDFSIKNTTVNISKSKRNVYITIIVEEGLKYTFGETEISGNYYPLKESDLFDRILTKKGNVFNRQEITKSTEAINEKLGNFGYAFSNVNPIPNVIKKDLVVNFNYFIEPGRKVYVRRINFLGNEKTKDMVLRREMRQLESSWYAKDKINLSKSRLTRTRYFDAVDIQTISVPSIADQIDLNVKVVERQTGSVKIGAGISSSDGVMGSFSVSQANFLGTGNTISLSMSSGSVNKVYSLNYTDPYFTQDGVSRTISLYTRETNTNELDTSLGNYDNKALGGGMSFGIPISERDVVHIGFNIDMSDIKLKSNSPQKYKNYCTTIGGSASSCDSSEAVLSAGFTSDTRDNVITPMKGYKWTANVDVSLPAFDMQYYKFELMGSHYYPLGDKVTLHTRGVGAYADSYGDDPYPFFKNFYVGGAKSVRGYKQSTIGKKQFDSSANNYVSYGGTTKLVMSTEVLFPVPGLKNNESLRLGAFIDGGGVWDQDKDINFGEMRFSTGLSVLWLSTFGPLNISLAVPLNDDNRDKKETFQFGMGTNF